MYLLLPMLCLLYQSGVWYDDLKDRHSIAICVVYLIKGRMIELGREEGIHNTHTYTHTEEAKSKEEEEKVLKSRTRLTLEHWSTGALTIGPCSQCLWGELLGRGI